jgi:hypothetical protein
VKTLPGGYEADAIDQALIEGMTVLTEAAANKTSDQCHKWIPVMDAYSRFARVIKGEATEEDAQILAVPQPIQSWKKESDAADDH